jgi:hypothetical protein
MNRGVMVASVAGSIVLVLASAWIARFEYRLRPPVALAAKAARKSQEIRQLIGEPMHVSRIAKGRLLSNRGSGSADLTIQIRGPLGRGTLDEWAQENKGRWHICTLQFLSNGNSIPIALVDGSLTRYEPE